MATHIQRVVRGHIGRIKAKAEMDHRRLADAQDLAEEAEMDLESAKAALKRATQRHDGQVMLAMRHEVTLASKRWEESMVRVKEATSIKNVRAQAVMTKAGLLKLIKVREQMTKAKLKLIAFIKPKRSAMSNWGKLRKGAKGATIRDAPLTDGEQAELRAARIRLRDMKKQMAKLEKTRQATKLDIDVKDSALAVLDGQQQIRRNQTVCSGGGGSSGGGGEGGGMESSTFSLPAGTDRSLVTLLELMAERLGRLELIIWGGVRVSFRRREKRRQRCDIWASCSVRVCVCVCVCVCVVRQMNLLCCISVRCM